VKLYTSPYAPSPRRVRMYAAEKGIALEYVSVDIAANETQSADFLAINPLAETPVLELNNGQRLTESMAICRYLDDTHPGPDLFGATVDERAAINQWVDRLLFRLYVPTTHAFRHGHAFWVDRIPQVPAYAEVARAQVLAEWSALDHHLAQRNFIARSQFSMADIVGFVAIDFAKVVGLRVGDDRPHLAKWYQHVRSRASASA
jgi:glutathione S-transferase